MSSEHTGGTGKFHTGIGTNGRMAWARPGTRIYKNSIDSLSMLFEQMMMRIVRIQNIVATTSARASHAQVMQAENLRAVQPGHQQVYCIYW